MSNKIAQLVMQQCCGAGCSPDVARITTHARKVEATSTFCKMKICCA